MMKVEGMIIMDKNNKSGIKAFKSMRKTIITGAAIIVIGTSTSVAAAENTDYFSKFFGGIANSFVKDTHDQVVVKSGVKMKIEESVSGGKSSLIIVSFEKEDGTSFPEGASISNLEVDVKHGASYMVEQKLTEDRKKIIAMFDLDSLSNLEGKSVTVRADAIMSEEKNVANGPFKNKFIIHDRSSKTDIDVTLKKENEEVVLNTIYLSAIGIGLEGERIDGQSSYLPQISPNVKVMTSDNQTIELSPSSTSTTDIGFKWQYSMNSNGDRIFLDKTRIKNILINDQIITID
jgi:hypothetical protein